MKIRIIIGLLALFAIFALILNNKVWAGESKKVTILKDFVCGLLDGNGSLVYVSDQNKAMLVGNKDDKSKLTCRGRVSPSAKKAMIYNFENTGAECYTLFGITRDWQEVVTPSGEATLQCRVK